LCNELHLITLCSIATLKYGISTRDAVCSHISCNKISDEGPVGFPFKLQEQSVKGTFLYMYNIKHLQKLVVCIQRNVQTNQRNENQKIDRCGRPSHIASINPVTIADNLIWPHVECFVVPLIFYLYEQQTLQGRRNCSVMSVDEADNGGGGDQVFQ